MAFDPVTLVTRFGTGLSPRHDLPQGLDEIMDRLAGPDTRAVDFPIPPMAEAEPTPARFAELRRAERQVRGTDEGEAINEEIRALVRTVRDSQDGFIRARLSRALTAPVGLRERLTSFWADHFTVRAPAAVQRHYVSSYVEEAIRRHVTGRFADMLKAVVTHPMMLIYLNQSQSMGPNSVQAERRDRGLNENLAREILELHTLGVDGPYGQTDVRQLAELLTGLSFQPREGFVFRDVFAEPGAEEVLGQSYGGAEPNLADIEAVLEDLAAHPATAQHLAQKLAVHFVNDDPDADLVAHLAQVFSDTGGDLLAVTEALLRHPLSWGGSQKVKRPYDFILSSMRALGLAPADIADWRRPEFNRMFHRPLTTMGQGYQRPNGPDGWPEAAEDWITPQGMAGRISWAMEVPQRLVEPLPDPRDFARAALGPEPPQDVVFAASAAERVRDGIGLVLASAAFQRR